jgi:ABC-type antimicrobial peptide transport system permease subunit
LKGTFKAGRLASVPRKVLVVVQFTVSSILIIGTSVVYQQIQFAKDRPIGCNKTGIVAVPAGTEEVHKHIDAIKKELINSGAVVEMSEAGSLPTQTNGTSSGFSWQGKDPNLSVDFPFITVSFDYGKTIDWNLKSGRDFSRDFPSDTAAMIINESAVRYMGFTDAIGQTIKWNDDVFQVIGVIGDIISQNPYETVKPSVYVLNNATPNIALLKLNPKMSASASMEKIAPVFKKFNPEQPFEYYFADEEFAKKFATEVRIGKLAGFFSLLAIVISCLGLFGLASFVAEQRTKEIGVRKVLGASVFSVWNLLSKDFVMLVLISFVIASPLAWLMMKQWLQNYSYRVGISWQIFAFAGILSILIALITVSFQAIRAALANPTRSLRTE